ncbi:adenine glycosylase [Rhodomicrobium udaipurense JA643]|uniref:Adenine DNA glycosylase n=1 Tax=Rhodomicrobium udaipurense TaxID=1202716 RepID=A0A8I1GJA8_9HYPH|nr:A/G-specific adenine glycosylase [Rhodomicrobium udaipurense]KAI96272.1 adenine glycosylase [Rhodomicrobium udaipurense JA643]MBJ7544657.1 A/G-specific adenine glycosylase [Rhodomicrobium udaipurense]
MQKRHSARPAFAAECFQHALLRWYDTARRDLPWRAKPDVRADPYRVWLSEIMLQQTTVKAVIPYFEAFTRRWPTVDALAAASRDEVLAAWAGLGYYSRARNLHACAQALAEGGFPADEVGLRALPGVGAYTSAAIAAIAFDLPAAVVDGNVERVLARVFAVETPLPAAKPELRNLAAELTPALRPGDYAQAMMDLGAGICSPRSPSCLVCPVRAFCAAAAMGDAERFPLRAAKAARPTRRGEAFVIVRGGCILLRRRADKGLLGGMMEVPTSDWVANGAVAGAAAKPKRGRPKGDTAVMVASPRADTSPAGAAWRLGRTVQHTFTHFHLELRVLAADADTAPSAAAAFTGEWAALDNLAAFALPSVMKKAVASGLEALGLARAP